MLDDIQVKVQNFFKNLDPVQDAIIVANPNVNLTQKVVQMFIVNTSTVII